MKQNLVDRRNSQEDCVTDLLGLGLRSAKKVDLRSRGESPEERK